MGPSLGEAKFCPHNMENFQLPAFHHHQLMACQVALLPGTMHQGGTPRGPVCGAIFLAGIVWYPIDRRIVGDRPEKNRVRDIRKETSQVRLC